MDNLYENKNSLQYFITAIDSITKLECLSSVNKLLELFCGNKCLYNMLSIVKIVYNLNAQNHHTRMGHTKPIY